MKTARRRQRTFDHFATPAGVRTLLRKLREAAPDLIPATEKQAISLLNATRHAERSPSAGLTSRGRPRLWQTDHLSQVAVHLRQLLDRETQGRVSPQTFIGQHLRLLNYPAEVAAALQSGEINKQEALALSRLTAEKLQTTEAEAERMRLELLRAHLDARGSQNQLRERVKALLGENAVVSTETLALGLLKSDALLEVKAEDIRHVFFETMKELFYAIRRFEPTDLNEEDIEEFMAAADILTNTIHTIEQRITQRKSLKRAAPGFATNPALEHPVEIITDSTTGQIIYKFPQS